MTTENESENTEVEIEVEVAKPEEAQEEQSADPVIDYDPNERVEIDDPKVQRKFNDIYKQMKMSDTRNKFLSELNEKMAKRLEDVESRFSQTDHAEAERTIKTRLKEARDSGDDDQADRILDELIEFRLESKLSRAEKKPLKVAKPDAEAERLQTEVLSAATDNNGNLVMGWLSADSPKHKQAMSMAPFIAAQVQAEIGHPDIGEVMRRIDDSMKKPINKPLGNSRAPDPMRGSLTNNKPKGTIKLSQAEMAMAAKLGVKPEAYAKWK